MKTERFEIRLDEALSRRLDQWQNEQNTSISRAETIRKLIDMGLSVTNKNEIYPNNSEKLILSILSEIMIHFDIRQGIDPNLIQNVILGGHYWALNWEMGSIMHSQVDSPEAVRQVVDILDMWTFIENSFDALSVEEQKQLTDDPNIANCRFAGFDGNNETEHFGIARFLIHDLKRFGKFKSHPTDLNSHSPKLFRYLDMTRKFEPIRKNLAGRRMNVNELASILSLKN